MLALASCAGKATAPAKRVEHPVFRIALDHVHARRPSAAGAKPDVGPGGEDYVSNPRPGPSFDCVPMEALFSGISTSEAISCLASIQERKKAVYRLKREPVPYYELQAPEDIPALLPECLKKTIPRIPVPREIFFQSDAKKDLQGAMECFSARLPIESDEVPALGLKWPLLRTQLEIDFPLEVPPASSAMLIRLLATWVLTPFFEEESGELRSTLVPKALCRRCLGEKRLLGPHEPMPIFWPGSETGER